MKKIYIIAGESSGDIIGSRLIQALKQMDSQIEFFGIGGVEMEKLGLKSLFPMENLAIMGFVEIIMKIFFFKKLINKTIQHILNINPDALITIDSLGFNQRVAKKIKELNPKIHLIHYVAPSVWAWKPKRAKKLAQIYDHLLCLFKFELPYFEKEHLKSYFVGHPIVQSTISTTNIPNFITKYNLNKQDTHIVLMPGSRITEISRLLPIFCESIKQLRIKYPAIKILLPTVNHMHSYIKDYLDKHQLNFILISDQQDKYDALALAKIGIIASGTASLELAMAKLPTLVAYKINPITAYIAYKLVKIKYTSIVNIMSNQPIIKELIQKDCNVKNIVNYVDNFLQNDYIIEYQDKILQILEEIGYNKFIPSHQAANIVMKILNTNKES